MTFQHTRDVVQRLATRTPDDEAQAVIKATLPIILEWSRNEISDDELFDITTPKERGVTAMFLMFDEQYRTIMRDMLDASVAVQEKRHHLLQTERGIVTKKEAAEHHGVIRNGRIVFAPPEAPIKQRQTRDVPF